MEMKEIGPEVMHHWRPLDPAMFKLVPVNGGFMKCNLFKLIFVNFEN